MSRSENRHHRARVIHRRVQEIKERWNTPHKVLSDGWILRQAQGKTNPFTSCSCEGCQCSGEHREFNRRERKAAKLAAHVEGDE